MNGEGSTPQRDHFTLITSMSSSQSARLVFCPCLIIPDTFHVRIYEKILPDTQIVLFTWINIRKVAATLWVYSVPFPQDKRTSWRVRMPFQIWPTKWDREKKITSGQNVTFAKKLHTAESKKEKRKRMKQACEICLCEKCPWRNIAKHDFIAQDR